MTTKENNAPSQRKDNSGTYGCSQVRVYAFTPIFAKIAVNAAKRAESNAYNFHIETIYVEFNYSRTESRPQQGDDFQVFKY